MCFQEMTAHSRAVGAADDDVWMQRRLAVSPKGDVAKERNDLDLLRDGNLSVAFRLPVEEPEHCITARADAGELGGRNTALAGKALNAANRLIALAGAGRLRLPIPCDRTAATLQCGRPRVAPEPFKYRSNR